MNKTAQLFFEIYKNNTYVISILSSDKNLNFVSILFVEGACINFVKEGLYEENIDSICGNTFYIIKENDKLLIADLYDEIGEFKVEFSKKTLLKLLEQWQYLVSKNTQEIVFYRNGDEYGMVDAQDFH